MGNPCSPRTEAKTTPVVKVEQASRLFAQAGGLRHFAMGRRFFGSERGSVLAFLTISMTLLVSFAAGVMDIGTLYETRRQLQNGADGAALAGAFELAMGNGQAAAINAALDYAQRNAVAVSEIAAGYPQVSSEAPYTDNAVVVAANRRLNLLVAGLFNNGVGDVGAQATAVVGPVFPTEALWPWAVPQSEAIVGPRIGLKLGAPPGVPGNFRALDFPPLGGGANDYRDDIEDGYGASTGDFISGSLPWLIHSETGNVVGPTRQGIDYLLNMANFSGQDDPSSSWNTPNDICTWDDAPKSPSDPNVFPPAGFVGNASTCYRIGIVPLMESYELNGKEEATIVGWSAFYLIGYTNGAGGTSTVWGYFLDKAIISGGRTNWGAPMSGLLGVRLWR